MKNSATARRYAKALFDISVEQNALDAVYADMQSIAAMIEQSPEFRAFLHNPVIPNAQKKDAMKALFDKKIHTEVYRFMHLICDHDRENILGDMIEAFETLRNEKLGFIHAEVISVVDMTPDQVKGVTEKIKALTGKTPQLVFKKDASLIGGFMVRIGDTMIDGTVKHQLERLKSAFTAVYHH